MAWGQFIVLVLRDNDFLSVTWRSGKFGDEYVLDGDHGVNTRTSCVSLPNVSRYLNPQTPERALRLLAVPNTFSSGTGDFERLGICRLYRSYSQSSHGHNEGEWTIFEDSYCFP